MRMETASGLVIAKSLNYPTSCNHTRFEKKSRAHYRGAKRNLEDSRLLFPMKGRTYRTPARAEESFMSIGTIILIILVIALLADSAASAAVRSTAPDTMAVAG